ncbi:uncharacterized protein [Malus domestica]|uniref:uncharacterized protein n=1 Tax=Malus domestica TaxID=3750 RepID=UPI00397479B9
MVIDSSEKWHEKLGNTLWAYRTSKRAGTGTTPYALTFGQDAVLPMEINVSSVRIQNQFGLHIEEYIEAMCQGIEDLDVARIEALNQIQEGKRAVARAYNKRVKEKSYKEGDLVWKTVLPLGAQLRGFGKWSPTWEGPFIVSQVLDKRGYYLADLEGNWQKHPINVKFLKRCNDVSVGFLVSSWVEFSQVIRLCGQDVPGRGSSSRVITIYDGEA